MSRDRRESIFVFQLALAIFFFIQGIVGIVRIIGINAYNFSVISQLILSVLILFSGVILLAGCFNIGRPDTIRIFTFFIMIVWAMHIFIQYIISGIDLYGGNLSFTPRFIEWLPGLCKDIIILASLSLVAKKYSKN